MMLKQSLYIWAIFCVVQSVNFPSTWTACNKDDPQNNECLKGAIQVAITDLSSGGKPSLGVLPLDPLHSDAITVEGESPLDILLDLSDLDFVGFKNLIVENVNNDWNTMQIDTLTPTLTLVSNYSIDGALYGYPIQGHGDCELVFTNYKAIAELKIREVEKGNAQYYEVFDFHFETTTDNLHINFDNLYNGNKPLGDSMNAYLKEIPQEMFQVIGPAISRDFEATFKNISNTIFSQIPINEISP